MARILQLARPSLRFSGTRRFVIWFGSEAMTPSPRASDRLTRRGWTWKCQCRPPTAAIEFVKVTVELTFITIGCWIFALLRWHVVAFGTQGTGHAWISFVFSLVASDVKLLPLLPRTGHRDSDGNQVLHKSLCTQHSTICADSGVVSWCA